jgi:Zn-dependent peptidase ImmA (M78 family)
MHFSRLMLAAMAGVIASRSIWAAKVARSYSVSSYILLFMLHRLRYIPDVIRALSHFFKKQSQSLHYHINLLREPAFDGA